MTRRLEADLLTAGEDIVRVLPKLMAHIRDSARTYGKSDALAVARAALREPDLPVARLDGIERDIRLLVDHREALARERTTLVDRLRWYLPELDPATEITTRGFRRLKAYALVDLQLADKTGTIARPARDHPRVRERTRTTHQRARPRAARHPRLRGPDRSQDRRRNRRRGPLRQHRCVRPL